METYGYAAMFLAMAAENANIPIPSEIILGFAGFLISQQIFSFWPTFIIACIAGVFGSVISYWLGSYGGRPLLLKYGKYIFFNEKNLLWRSAYSPSTAAWPSSFAVVFPAYAHSFLFLPVSPAIPL